ncbi:MAG TPA: NAD(P)H-dependent oxidoreductase, partial [Xanthobacteraceae bacterium]|nr:NAD(P)H-dependent oxidoreductase [Xanthobacteraceae bacterium]
PKILVFPGSLRSGSHNVRLAALVVKELVLAEAEVTRISLADYPLPLYDGDLETRSGPPAGAIQLKRMLSVHQGVFIVTPEYNASVPPLVKNTIDWISRVRERGEAPLAVFKRRAFALGSASPGGFGGMRSLLALRQVLEIGCGALVLPEQIAVPRADAAFDDMDNLKDEHLTASLKTAVRALIDATQRIA